MKLEDVKTLLDSIGIQSVYKQYDSGTAPELPFVTYYVSSDSPFFGDDEPYYSIPEMNIELYTEKKNITLEAQLEAALLAAGVGYVKTESYLQDELMYEVLYEFELGD